jgi:hypothetical protein
MATQGYYPYGETRYHYPVLLRGSTGSLYTGQRSISKLGLMDYKARMYDLV